MMVSCDHVLDFLRLHGLQSIWQLSTTLDLFRNERNFRARRLETVQELP